jgi:predicted alpha/beta hydrolase
VSSPTASVEARPIPAVDGFRLSATFFMPSRPNGSAVIVSSATAVPRGFYRRFATALAGGGYVTITYDYRGIGESRPASLRGFEAEVRDWALLDMQGVLDWVHAEFEPNRTFMVGHSVGGQVAGLLERPGRIDGMVTMSAQSGHWRLQGGSQRQAVAFHVYVSFPMLAAVLGYLPWSRFSNAEDLPKGVALEWARWCRNRDYLLGDETLPLERYERFTAPVLAYSFEDDDWGTARSVDAMMSAYPNVERRHLAPADIEMDRIGHMGAFRPEAATLWAEVIDWLGTH